MIKFCENLGNSEHWAVQALASKEGKKITQAMLENARKRESNTKLLEAIETAFREQLGKSDVAGLGTSDHLRS